MRKSLTIKQSEFVKRYIENKGNGTQAALESYDTQDSNVAHAIASENLRKPTIQKAIHQALEAKGLTPDSISEYLKEAIVSGLGKKATNSDSLRGIDIYSKITGLYNQPHVQEDIRIRLTKMSNKELIFELEKSQKRMGQLLEEINS